MPLGYILTLREIVEYYTEREDVQRALLAHGSRRRTVIGSDSSIFGKRSGPLASREQIAQMLRSLLDKETSVVPRKYPAFHSCITSMPGAGRLADGGLAADRRFESGFAGGSSGPGVLEPQAAGGPRRGGAGLRAQVLDPTAPGTWDCAGSDLVIDIDIKTDQREAFKQGRKVIDLLDRFGVPCRIKFSGNASPHVIVPAALFPPELRGAGFNQTAQRLIGFITSKSGATNVDGSFSSPDHYLRMPYSLNENTGLVSVPIPRQEYDSFHVEMAEAQAVVVQENWMSVAGEPTDGVEALLNAASARRR